VSIFAGSLFAVLISLDNLSLSFFFDTAQSNTTASGHAEAKVVAFGTGMARLVSLSRRR
jgi:hypothetical protein